MQNRTCSSVFGKPFSILIVSFPSSMTSILKLHHRQLGHPLCGAPTCNILHQTHLHLIDWRLIWRFVKNWDLPKGTNNLTYLHPIFSLRFFLFSGDQRLPTWTSCFGGTDRCQWCKSMAVVVRFELWVLDKKYPRSNFWIVWTFFRNKYMLQDQSLQFCLDCKFYGKSF